jgi:hypothetical protein
MSKPNEPQIGDYVIATKYSDGDPCDGWAVGFLAGMTSHAEPRYDVVDGDGKSFRAGGFRRARRIAGSTGKKILALGDAMQYSGRSVWSFVRGIERGLL